MSESRYARAKEILLGLLALPPAERPRELERLCGEDLALRSEVESLLAHDAASEDDLDDAIRGAAPDGLHQVIDAIGVRRHPRSIGPYEITGILGEGGMGVVYRGRQSEPIEREVAIKFVRSSLATDRVLARFDWERKSLARMDHPHIAKVFDAGADALRRPYVVMELVDGAPLTAFCDRHRMDVDARLHVFLDVCGAIRHAHERGVLHRDLKPSNVLVRELDGRPKPTVIDFGVAKALDDSADGDLTVEGQRVGTPAYMSPEQLAGDFRAVDTRTDVYALGVMLYELLCGGHPFGRDDGVGEDTLLRRRSGARAPSEALPVDDDAEASARARGTSPERLSKRLRGDLDTICLEAIHPDPDRRYASVAALMEDIERTLADRPILARPDSWSYRARKFARRRPAVVVAILAAIAFAGAGVVALSLHAERLQTERDRALAAEERTREEAQRVREIASLLESIFTEADPTLGGSGDFTARELLDQATQKIRAELADQPGSRGRLLRVISASYHALSDLDSAESAARASIEALESQGAAVDHSELATAYSLLGVALHDLGRYEDAEASSRRSVEEYRLAEGGAGPDVARELSYLATAVQAQGRVDDAIPILAESISMGLEFGGEEDPDVVWARNMLGYLQYQKGRYRQARGTFREILEIQRRGSGEPTIDLAHTLNNLGGIDWYLDEDEAARESWTEALEIYQGIYGSEHPAVARAHSNLGKLLVELGEVETGAAMVQAAVDVDTRLLGQDHPNTISTRSGLAVWREAVGDLDGAEAIRRENLRRWVEVAGPDHRRTITARLGLIAFLTRRGAYAEAEEALEPHWRFLEERLGEEHPDLALARLDRAAIALASGDPEAARGELLAAAPVLEAVFDPGREPLRRLEALRAGLD